MAEGEKVYIVSHLKHPIYVASSVGLAVSYRASHMTIYNRSLSEYSIMVRQVDTTNPTEAQAYTRLAARL